MFEYENNGSVKSLMLGNAQKSAVDDLMKSNLYIVGDPT